jgi:hypothetical protein
MNKWWNNFWFAAGSPVTLGVCRALFFGLLFGWMVTHDFSAWGGYSQVFWMPIWLFDTFDLPQLSGSSIAAMQAIWKGALLLSTVGLWTRAATVTAFVLGVYLMGLPHNFGQTQHFDTLVVFVTGVLAVSRAGDAVSLDALLARRRGRTPTCDNPWEYTWPIRFVWVAISLIFCAAGISKLRHSGLEWVFSDNLSLLLLRQQYHLSDGEPLTNWGIWVANQPAVVRTMAASSIAIEVLFPLVLFGRVAKFVLVPAGLAFLVGIRVLMGPTFEQFMICYVFWAPVFIDASVWQPVVSRRRHSPTLIAHHAATRGT